MILVVDDDADIRESLEVLLQLHGYRVALAGDGVEALAWLRGGAHPCLILLDLMMPRMNGVQLRHELAADPQLAGIPIVVITGAGAYAQAKAVELDAQILRKPFDLRTLLATVQRFCPAGA
jgi:CheY-like chemotaxis protein